MKKGIFSKLALVAMMATAVTFTACDDDDEVVKFVPSFPEEAQTVTDAESCTVTFTANDVWTLSSDASWAVFENGSTTTQGEAGEQSVAVKVTLSRENSGKTASITLTYPNAPEQSMVIAKISQSPWVSEVKLVDAESIKVGYAGTTVKFTSNVVCAAKELPSFLTFNEKNTLELKEGETEVKIAFDENEIKNQAPDKTWNGKIEFYEENGEAAVAAINIEYTGMTADEFLINITSQYNWTVDLKSAEERYYRDMMGTKMNVYPEGIPFNVYAGDEIVFLHGVESNGKWWFDQATADTEYGVETTETGYQFFVFSTVQDKAGELYAMPKTEYAKIEEALGDGVEMGFIDEQYLVLTWAMLASGDLEFKDGLTLETINFEMNPDFGMEIGSVQAGHSVMVTVPNFNPEDFDNHLISVSLIAMDGSSEKNLVEEGKVEPMENGFLVSTTADMANNMLNIYIGENSYFIYVYSVD